MSLSLSITDQVTPALEDIAALLSGEDPGLREAAAAGAAEHLRGHLEKRNDTPNKLGGKRTNYWNDVAASTFHEVKGSDMVIGVDHVGAALHYFGGTIEPKRAKLLTIPASPAAHGKRAGEFENLAPVFFNRNKPAAKTVGALIRDDAPEGEFDVMFWLSTSADIPEDKTVLPPENDLTRAIIRAAEDALEAFNE